MKTSELSSFARAYVGCALWSGTGDNSQPLDSTHSIIDIEPASLATMAQEADAFAVANAADIEAAQLTAERAGFCFWLNRNGHGSGFWDEKGYNSPDAEVAACNRLSEASHAAGSRDLYVGDDGRIYQA